MVALKTPEFVRREIVVVRSANQRLLVDMTPEDVGKLEVAIRKCGVGSRSEPRLSGSGPR